MTIISRYYDSVNRRYVLPAGCHSIDQPIRGHGCTITSVDVNNPAQISQLTLYADNVKIENSDHIKMEQVA